MSRDDRWEKREKAALIPLDPFSPRLRDFDHLIHLNNFQSHSMLLISVLAFQSLYFFTLSVKVDLVSTTQSLLSATFSSTTQSFPTETSLPFALNVTTEKKENSLISSSTVNSIETGETHSIENIARKAVETTSLSLISTTKNGANKPMFKDKLLRPFGFVIKPERKVCTDTTRVFIAIHSAASNFGRRQVIRETYAQRKLQERYEFSFLFTLGLQESDLFQKWIVAEAKEFDDILQGNFQEHYHNMTIKKLIWMRYAMGNCQKTKWIVHLDDDALLDIHSLIDFFENKKVFDSNTLYCMAISYNQTLVVRNPYSKWFVSEDAYPLDFYPKYCAGAAYILPQKALYLMDEAIKGMEYITVDDAFITGIVREAVGINIRQLLPNGIVRHELDPLIHKFQTGRAVMAECPNEHCMRHLWEIIDSLHRLTHKPNVNISITTIPDYHPMEVEILVRYGETIHFDGGIDVQSLYELNSTREITLPQYVRYPRKLIFISLTLPISLMILLFLCKIYVFLANFFEEYYKKRVFTE